MGSLSIWHWIVVIAVVLLLFGRGKISDLMGDVAQGIKAFKKGMQDDDKTAEKPAEPVKSIDHNAAPRDSAPVTAFLNRVFLYVILFVRLRQDAQRLPEDQPGTTGFFEKLPVGRTSPSCKIVNSVSSNDAHSPQ